MDASNEHKRRYEQFVSELRDFLQGERGRASALARHLGIPRQSVSRWFVAGSRTWSTPPPWVALTANVWYHEQRRKELARAEQQSLGFAFKSLSTWGKTTSNQKALPAPREEAA